MRGLTLRNPAFLAPKAYSGPLLISSAIVDTGWVDPVVARTINVSTGQAGDVIVFVACSASNGGSDTSTISSSGATQVYQGMEEAGQSNTSQQAVFKRAWASSFQWTPPLRHDFSCFMYVFRGVDINGIVGSQQANFNNTDNYPGRTTPDNKKYGIITLISTGAGSQAWPVPTNMSGASNLTSTDAARSFEAHYLEKVAAATTTFDPGDVGGTSQWQHKGSIIVPAA